jgi:AcrR family transcriptional regulator
MAPGSKVVANASKVGRKSATNSTKCRLIYALLDAWCNSQAEDVSVRLVARGAAAAQSSINFHFGSMEQLYLAATQAALDEARAWMEQRLEQFGTLAAELLPAALQASVIASVITDWTTGQRRLALASRYAPHADWEVAWREFWGRIASLLGLGEHADALACFASGETARHLLVWKPALDRALLEETAFALVLWLRERRFAADPVRPVHQRLALTGYASPKKRNDALAGKIGEAAAELLAQQGHDGVTFRAVAAHAGVTLGKVIHICGTKSELLRTALHYLYEREALGGDRDGFVGRSVPRDVLLDHLLDAVLTQSHPVLRAYDEIELAIYNGAEYAALRGVVRSMDDPSGAWALRQLLDGKHPPAALVAAFSAIVRGIGYQIARVAPGICHRDIAKAALQSMM